MRVLRHWLFVHVEPHDRRAGLAFLREPSPRARSYAPIVTANEAAALCLGRHPPASPSAARRLRCRGPIGSSLSRHRATEFKGLVEVLGHAGCLVASIAKIHAILARQAPEGEAEGAQFGGNTVEAGKRISHWDSGSGHHPE